MRYQSPLVYEWTSITKAQLYEWVAYTHNVQKTSHLEADLVLEGSSDPAEHCAHHTLLSPTKSEGYSFGVIRAYVCPSVRNHISMIGDQI